MISVKYIITSIHVFCDRKVFFSSEINECYDGTHSCSSNALCTNTYGDYNCTCKSGYEGSGFNCTGKKAYIIL